MAVDLPSLWQLPAAVLALHKQQHIQQTAYHGQLAHYQHWLIGPVSHTVTVDLLQWHKAVQQQHIRWTVLLGLHQQLCCHKYLLGATSNTVKARS